MTRFPFDGVALGCDYNPEQWPRAVWREDIRLMQAAGVGFVTLGVFSWARLEPRAGEYDFDWLDEVVALLADGGIAIDMATATAAPPPWLTTAHPEILPVDQAGHTLWPGSRQSWCPSSPIFREHALELVEQMALRYGAHPAVRLWHVSNELGCHNGRCWCDVSAAAFRRWLAGRYGDIEKLNEAWGTAFWSQRYTDWAEVMPPRATPTWHNPTQVLDFKRFAARYCARQDQTPEGLREVLRTQRARFKSEGFMLLECAMLDSSRLGELVIIGYGGDHTFKSVPDHPISPRGLASDMSVVVAVLPAEEV